MDNFVDERDRKLSENDKYTFFVLNRVMGGECELLLTDHERLIVCYTSKPYPVWIWTPDDAPEADMDRAYRVAAENGLIGKHRFNLKYDLAMYFIKRAAADNKKLAITMNCCAYACEKLVAPTVIADGAVHRCVTADLDELTEFLTLFHEETGTDRTDPEKYRLQAEAFIAEGNTFFWKDENGTAVAGCRYVPNGELADIGLVFTRPEFRRKHYAENLVHAVTELIKGAGYIPMLYTDADYVASNACYMKIGYTPKGRLCTIGPAD